ncbi:hypothetical protein EDD11_007539 [Mortierella claussenii]|nr:hypothetical protein EDD11_007539 [Mortierella claussenii]
MFPNLHALKLQGCKGAWMNELTWYPNDADPLFSPSFTAANTANVLFKELRSLTLWIEFQSSRARLVNLVRGRPHLTSLETDVLPITREDLLELSLYCSQVIPRNSSDLGQLSVFQSMAIETKRKASVPPVALNNKFKRLAVQTYASPVMSTEALNLFYTAPCFLQLEHVYIQTRDLSMDLFPFAKTLCSLNLGGMDAPLQISERLELNQILRQLPALQILKIERNTESYDIFKGLGRDPGPLTAQKQQSSSADWSGERPLLRELKLFVCPFKIVDMTAPFAKGDDGVALGSPMEVDLHRLQRRVLDRFRFLEQVHLKAHKSLALPEVEQVRAWEHNLKMQRSGGFVPHLTLAQ